MECWYDTLFKVNCAGVLKLSELKCAFGVGSVYANFHKQGGALATSYLMHPKFYKRLYWVMACGGIASGKVIILDSFRTNKETIFFQTDTLFRPVVVPGGTTLVPMKDLHPSCYHLGTYQKYWNADNDIMVSVTNLWTWNVWGMGTAPRIPEELSFVMASMTDEDIGFFFGNKRLQSVIKQREYFKRRSMSFDECIKKNFPQPFKVPQVKIPGPTEPLEWPGKPFSELTMPTVEMPPGPIPKAPDKKLTLTIALYETPPPGKDGLTLYMFLKEEYS